MPVEQFKQLISLQGSHSFVELFLNVLAGQLIIHCPWNRKFELLQPEQEF